MFLTLTKRSLYRIALSVFMAVLFFSCQKEISTESGGVVVTPPDLSTKIKSSVSGFVTNENDAPVMGASVQFGTSSTTTDKYGYFEVKNADVVKTAAIVSVSNPGYFKGIKTYMAKENKNAFFRIKLIPKTTVGNINAASGGTVTLTNGLSIVLPAGAVVNAATNAAYTGIINVSAFWINPQATDLDKIMPGDLRGLDKDGTLKLLQTYGMAAVELTGSSGELLQIAAGKKATLTLPLTASMAATAPSSIPLWFFDEANGLWKEEGSAVKNGNSYVGDVAHFTYWNADLPGPYVQFDCTVKDAFGNALQWAYVKVGLAGNPFGASCHGYTDSSGFISGPIPANSQLTVEVYPSPYYCGVPLNTQTITTTNANISLGDIIITHTTTPWMTVTGTVLDCNNTPVTTGYIVVFENSQPFRYELSSGSFIFSIPACNASSAVVNIIGVDQTHMQESGTNTYTVVPGNNNVGNIVACTNNSTEFFNYSVNGTPYSITTVLTQYANIDSIRITANTNSNSNWAYTGFNAQNIAVNSTQLLDYFTCSQITGQTSVLSPVSVHITEYGNIGQFVSGNFSGTITGTNLPNTTYAITCNFRVRRYY